MPLPKAIWMEPLLLHLSSTRRREMSLSLCVNTCSVGLVRVKAVRMNEEQKDVMECLRRLLRTWACLLIVLILHIPDKSH